MSEAGLPRLVFERWTDPVAGDILDEAEIDVVRLDVTASAEQGWDVMESAHGYQVATRTDVASVADGSQWLAGPSLVERCKHLLAVCSAGAGYDVIDVEACTRAGIAVCNNSGPGAEAVAEHALGFMLDLAKKITVADRVLRGGELGDRLALRGSQLLGKTLGVIGLGAIGSRLVELCAPFGMEVIVFDPYLDDVAAQARGVQRVALSELVERSDFVQVTCPLTAETAGLVGKDQFAAMKPDRVLYHHCTRASARRGGASRGTRRPAESRARDSTYSTRNRRGRITHCCIWTMLSPPRTPPVSRLRPPATSRSRRPHSGRRSSTVACRHGCSTLMYGLATARGFTTNSVSVPPRNLSKPPPLTENPS